MISIYTTGGIIGSLLTTKMQYSGSVDAAFILLNESSYVSTLIGGSGNEASTYYVETALQYAPIKMYGNVTGNALGIICSTSYTAVGNPGVSETITDLIKASFASSGGDSGCISYTGNGYDCPIYGIMSKRSVNNDYSCICKAGNIYSYLGIQLR